jgi:hypothetical protein
MIWVRKFGVFILAILLLVMVLITTLFSSLVISANNPKAIKGWVAKSGVYDHFMVALLNKSGSNADTTSAISIQDPQVQSAAQEVFTPQVIQNGFETIIDSNYDWLSGKKNKPDFAVDLTNYKQQFAENVQNKVKNFLTNLPNCTPQQTLALQGQLNVKLFGLTCRPANVNPTTEAARARDQILNSDFLSTPVLTASTITVNDNNSQVYYVKFAKAPSIYKEARITPLVMLTITLLLSFLILITSTSKDKGKKNIAIVFFVSAFILILEKILIEAARVSQKVVWVNVDFSKDLNKPLNDLVFIVFSNVTNICLVAALLLVIAGVLLIRSARKSGNVVEKKRLKKKDIEQAIPETNPIFFEEDEPPAPKPKASPTPTPKIATKTPPRKPKKPRLIQ